MYNLPLLPGYGPNANIRSSTLPSSDTEEPLVPASEAEDGYTTSLPASPAIHQDGYLASMSAEADIHVSESASENKLGKRKAGEFAEVVFFSYGVVVFFGLEEEQEQAILDDVQSAGVMRSPVEEARWEVEECHYAVRSLILNPRDSYSQASQIVRPVYCLPPCL